MRLLILSSSMGMGGADQQVLVLARAMRGLGHDLKIVSLTPLGPMGVEAQKLGISTESLNMPRGVPDPRGLIRLVRILRAWTPDVVHSHMVHANLMARVVRLFAPIPALISTIHNVYEGGGLRMAAYRLTNGMVDQVTIVSEAAADRFVGEGIVPRNLIRVIPNGLDTERFRVAEEVPRSVRRSLGLENEFVWLAVGRFEVAKDHPNMLHAFARVRQSHPNTVLLLVGRGSLQSETEMLARDLGLTEHVRFLGVRHDVPEIMSAADGYVLSSAWEGMPIVLLEAAAAGLPIVATRVGGNHEVVREGKSGFLVPPAEPEALAAAMLGLMKLTGEERRALGLCGREYVQRHYGVEQLAGRWEELYRAVLSEKGLAPTATIPA